MHVLASLHLKNRNQLSSCGGLPDGHPLAHGDGTHTTLSDMNSQPGEPKRVTPHHDQDFNIVESIVRWTQRILSDSMV